MWVPRMDKSFTTLPTVWLIDVYDVRFGMHLNSVQLGLLNQEPNLLVLLQVVFIAETWARHVLHVGLYK